MDRRRGRDRASDGGGNRNYRSRSRSLEKRSSHENRIRRRSRSRSRSRVRMRSRSRDRAFYFSSSSHRNERNEPLVRQDHSRPVTSSSKYHDFDRPESRQPRDEKRITEKFAQIKIAPDSESVLIKEMINGGNGDGDKEESITEDDEEAQLAALLGFSGFTSTKGQKVQGNRFNGAAEATKKRREYRQYLFVKGAYDIPLTKDQVEAKEKERDQKQKQYS